MVRFYSVIVLVLLVIGGCGGRHGPDPVIGVWEDSMVGETLFEFKADGTVVNSFDYERCIVRIAKKYPNEPERVTWIRERAGRVKPTIGTWRKKGRFYVKTFPPVQLGDATIPGESSFLIQDDTIIPYYKGKPIKGFHFVRRSR